MENKNCVSLNIVFFFPECSGLLGHRAWLERILTAPQFSGRLSREKLLKGQSARISREFFFNGIMIKEQAVIFTGFRKRIFWKLFTIIYTI
jgi:hypothetical protein